LDFAVKEIEKHGLELVFNDVYTAGTEDFYPIVTKALQENPDAIDLVLSIEPWAAGIIKAARELGFKGPVYSSPPIGDVYMLNGMLDPEYAYDIFGSSPDVRSPELPIVQEHRELVESEVEFPYTFQSLQCLMGFLPLLQAIEQANSFDTDEVVTTFENLSNIETVFGPGTITGEDIIGINRFVVGPIPFARIQNGEIESGFLSE
jgi:ABC-type branched-subunit amino acid transport system substrate-binding protein